MLCGAASGRIQKKIDLALIQSRESGAKFKPGPGGQTRFSSASTESEVFDPAEGWALSEGSYGDSIAAMHNISKDLVKAAAPTKEHLLPHRAPHRAFRIFQRD